MLKPLHNLCRRMKGYSLRKLWSVYHYNRQLEPATCKQLRYSASPTRVFTDNNIYLILTQQFNVMRNFEGSPRDDRMSVFKRQISFKWINQTQNIFMLLSNFKFRNLYSANCEENCSWFITFEHNCSRFYILNIFPIIARFFNPRFSCQRRKGYSQIGTSFKSIQANLFCKWMCRIDNVGNFVLNNVITETLWTSKASNTYRYRLRLRALDTASKRKGGINFGNCQQLTKMSGFRCPTEYQKVL